MELLYVWIEKHRNIEQQGFNFSPRWRFDYNPETVFLDIEDRREQVIDNFFGERISNVTAIVGANGSGKTTLLSLLVKNLEIPTVFWDENLILVFFHENQLRIWFQEDYTTYDSCIILENTSDFFECDLKATKNIYRAKDKTFHEKENIRGIYLSHLYNGETFTHNYKNILDKSTDQILYSIENRQRENPSQFSISNEYRWLEVRSQAKFISKFEQLEGNLKLPRFLQFNIHSEIEESLNNFISDKRLLANNRNLGRKIYTIETYLQPSSFLERIKKILCYSLIEATYKTVTDPLPSNLIDTFIENIDEQRDFINFDFNDIEYPFSPVFLPEIINLLSEHMIFNEERQEGLLPAQHVEDFFRLCGTLAEPCFIYDWRFGEHQKTGHLSSGEKHLINIFARIYDAANQLTLGQPQPIIIFLDEAELGLHPEWQRQFIDVLIKFLPEILPKDGKIQIILSTHSPFIISDLPKENVIFLSKDDEGNCNVHDGLKDKKQSFGANIHTLLSDGFFMNSLIGEFAKGKIDQVIKFLNNEGSDITEEKEAQKIIDMVGEPILKRELQRRMKIRKMSEVDTLKTQVAVLEQRIAELEKNDQ